MDYGDPLELWQLLLIVAFLLVVWAIKEFKR